MATLYYGGGDCTVEGNISSLIIYYRGAIVIYSKLPNGYTIELKEGKLIISSSSETSRLNDLFEYVGEFRVLSVTGNNLEGERESISIKKVMDYSELLNSKSEDLTVKSEDLKATHIHGRRISKMKLMQPYIENLFTDHDNFYLKDGNPYSGYFHQHIEDSRLMTGRTHTEESLDLYFKDIYEGDVKEELILYNFKNTMNTRYNKLHGRKARRRK